MARNSALLLISALLFLMAAPCAAQVEAPLPAGVKAVWTLDKAWSEKTPTRERVSLNGLWRWQPAKDSADAVPADKWGFFKVPGAWPGITDYLEKDSQTVFAHPAWKDEKLSGVTAAWYQREFTVPATWAGRRISITADYLNSYAVVYIDGKKAGEMRFPAGEVDLSAACKPGQKHVLSVLVIAMPLKGVMLSYNDTNSAKSVKGTVERRGLCGDVYLVGEPRGARITDVRIETSVRKGEIAFDAAVEGPAAYSLQATIMDGTRTVKHVESRAFKAADLKDGRFSFTIAWKPEKLWDLNTPGNTYTASVSLMPAAGGAAMDTAWPVRFGFREFWIDGRDFYLNGSRLWLSSVPVDNAQVGAAWSTYDAAKESLLRLKAMGINMVYTHNYGCEPGTHLSFEEILRAADDVGMLVSLSQPHFGQYDWKAADADAKNGYAQHAAFYVRVAGSHPSVVFYSMSHNATGYDEDMDPDKIDGLKDLRDNWSANNAKLALRAQAIVSQLDPTRIVYHHSSGNLGSMHTSNFYPNFAPDQELCDWFEHWATVGAKPMFTCEYAAPMTWDFTMYRGWYKGKREWGSAKIPWEYCFAEWSAQELGDRAFDICDAEKANLRWEAKQFKAGSAGWYRWDYPNPVGSTKFDDQHAIIGKYTTDNWRAYRTWGLSANSPWDYSFFWRTRDGLDRNKRTPLAVDWENLQRPGLSPDYIADRYERMDIAYDLKDWVPTADGQALLRNNQPLLAYIGGKPAAFTGKDHNFAAGQTVEKQLIIINNSRETVTCDGSWTFALPQPQSGTKKVTIKTGEQERVPLKFALPPGLAAGKYELKATVKFSDGSSQSDAFEIDVTAAAPPVPALGKVALFDPKGETAKWLAAAGVQFQKVEATANLAAYDLVIIGKMALTVDGPAPDIGRVRDGLRVVIFEQSSDALQERLGFRTAEYGLRQVFERVPDHPALAGITPGYLHDWCGEATTVPPRLSVPLRPMYGLTVKWCGIDETRVWRCGCRGSVASVLVEKPARGDFLPIIDGGYSLQYAPLMEYREGKGLVVFCQLDVTGRTEADPAADRIGRNILAYAAAWKPQPARKAVYAGDAEGKAYLVKAGIAATEYTGQKLTAGDVLIVGPGGMIKLKADEVAAWLKTGGRMVALGMVERETAILAPLTPLMKKAEHISTVFEPFAAASPLAGVGPADVMNRDPRVMDLAAGRIKVYGDGVLASNENAVFCQLAPWQFDYSKQWDLKRSYRRSAFTLARLLANQGVAAETPLLSRFSKPLADAKKSEQRWSTGLYTDQPEELDDPYRFFRW